MSLRRQARSLVLSLRGQPADVARSPVFELEDLVVGWEPAHLIAPAGGAFAQPGRWGRLLQRGLRRAAPLARLAVPEPPQDRYELLVVLCRSPEDLHRLGPLDPYLERCDRAVCWFSELWACTIPQRRLGPLRDFDAVGLSYEGSVSPLRDALADRVVFVPPAVDALAFRPRPGLARTIDLYGLGRRDPALHGALREFSAERGWLYLFTTAQPGSLWEPPSEHRAQLADLVARTRYFVVHPAKFNASEQTRGQEELGYRYFEGLAGGAALLGNLPRSPGIRALFDWEDAVIELLPGTPADAVREQLQALERDPERLERVRRRNAQEALRQHDWVYRWEALLDAVGLPLTSEAEERKATLASSSQ